MPGGREAGLALRDRRGRAGGEPLLDDRVRQLSSQDAGVPPARNGASAVGSTSGLVEAMQQRLDEHPDAMRLRRETVEHPFGTLKMWMGATHFLMKRLHNVKTEMALSVLAYNFTRVMNIIGIKPLMAAIRA